MAYKDPYQEMPIKDFSYTGSGEAPPPRAKPKWGYVTAGLVVLILLGVGAFAYGHYTKNHKSKPAKTTTSNPVVSPPVPQPQLTSYTSVNFNLTVNYPKTWTVADNTGSLMTITSPVTALTSASGKSVQAEEVVNILNKGKLPSTFGTGSVAVLNSQRINFSNPTSAQAAQAYISFVQYPATTALGGLDGIYVTGNNGYQKAQNIPATDVSKVDPLIFISFLLCNNSGCSSTSTLTINSTMWTSNLFSTPILDILKSFSLS